MLTATHAALAIATTSLFTGTADPWVLGTAALASQIPDIDTSGSVTGRIFHPVSRWLEARFPHRSVTHSFLATALVAIVCLPLYFLDWKGQYWGLLIGYWMGWFGDVFSKSGVAAFFPHSSRLVIPGNPKLRLTTGSKAESIVLAIIVCVAIVSFNVNSSGGIMRSFDQVLGSQNGAIAIYQRESSKHQVTVSVRGRHTITQQAVSGSYEVLSTVAGDLLVRDAQGRLYRVGTSPEAQIAPEIINAAVGKPIALTTKELLLQDQPIREAIAPFAGQPNTFVSGRLTIDSIDRDGVNLHGSTQYFQPIRDFNGSIELESASPIEVLAALGDVYATGNLIVRSSHVQQQ